MVNDADGSMSTMRAVYVEVRRPDRLVWTEPDAGMTTTVAFAEIADGRTEVVTYHVNVPRRIPQPWGAARIPHQPRPLRRLRRLATRNE